MSRAARGCLYSYADLLADVDITPSLSFFGLRRLHPYQELLQTKNLKDWHDRNRSCSGVGGFISQALEKRCCVSSCSHVWFTSSLKEYKEYIFPNWLCHPCKVHNFRRASDLKLAWLPFDVRACSFCHVWGWLLIFISIFYSHWKWI